MAVPFDGDPGHGRRTCCPPTAAATAVWLWIFARLAGAFATELNLSTIDYSNLAGKGPHIRKPHGIRYHHVATAGGTPIDLLIAAAEDKYRAYDPQQNVLSGQVHQIRNVNLQAGTDVDLIFRFVKSGTSTLMMVEQLYFSVYMVDSRQRVQVGSYTSEALNRLNRYCRTNDTGLRFETLRNPSGISVTAWSNFPAFHPSDPHGLTSTEKNWVVTFLLVDVSEFPVRVSVSGPLSNDGLNFMFSGAASVDEYCSPWEDDSGGGPSGDSHRPSSHSPDTDQTVGVGASSGDCGDDANIDATNGPDLFSQVLTVLDRGRRGSGTSGPCSRQRSNGAGPSDELPGATSDFGAAVSPNSSSSTTGVAEPHDCWDGQDAWRTQWSDSKKDWCCQHKKLGCSTVDPFDCHAGREAWEKGWSDAKKAWCCEHHGNGCATASTTAVSSTTTATSTASSTTTTTATSSATTSESLDCHEAGNFTVACDMATTTALNSSYNCTEGHLDSAGNWSSARRQWCCEHHNRGCEVAAATTESPRSEAVARSTTSITRTTTASTQPSESGAANYNYTYDCDSEFSHRNTSWSHVKKAWCCKHFSVGCRFTTTVEATTSAPYDCEVGFQNWVNGWSAGKKAWCCRRFSRGCPSATTIIIANSEPYDCAAGLHNWQSGWSAGKKIWCCSHHGLACPRPVGAVAATVAATTTTYAYDCRVGIETWDQSWSYAKRTWCCERYGPDCHPEPQTTTFTVTVSSGANSMSAVTAAMAATTGSTPAAGAAVDAASTELYDCKVGFQHWDVGWSDQKKSWCCEHYSLGCPSEPFDCLTGLAHWQHGWSHNKKRWCCEHYGRGCYAAQAFYHCGTDLANWDKAWSPAKKQWCCGEKGIGCTTSPAPMKQGAWIGKSEQNAADRAPHGDDARRPDFRVHIAMFGACCLGFLALFTIIRSSDREAMSARTPSSSTWTHKYVMVDTDDEAPN